MAAYAKAIADARRALFNVSAVLALRLPPPVGSMTRARKKWGAGFAAYALRAGFLPDLVCGAVCGFALHGMRLWNRVGHLPDPVHAYTATAVSAASIP